MQDARKMEYTNAMTKNSAAVALGKLGGSKKSEAKTLAARLNAKKLRPRKTISTTP